MRDEDKSKVQLINELNELRRRLKTSGNQFRQSGNARHEGSEDDVHLLPGMILEISQAKDLRSAIEVALKNICEIKGWNYGEAWIRTKDGSALECIPEGYCSSVNLMKFKELTQDFIFPLGKGMPGRIWRSKNYEWVPDVSLVSEFDFPRAGFAREAGFRACLGVPIIASDEVLAVLVFLMFESKEEEMRLIDFISVAAAQLGSVIQRKKAEEMRRAASLYARNLIEASLDPLVTISSEGRIMDVNKATEGITGIPRENLVGTDFSDYFTEPENAKSGYQQVFSDGYVIDYPLSIRNISGNIIDVLYNATVYRDENGQIMGVFAAARDISQIKKAEEQRRAASLYARNLLEASLDPLVTISPEGKIMDVNKATEVITGFPREHLIGTDFSEYFTKPENARDGYQQVFSNGYVRDYSLSIRNVSGNIIDVLYNATVYRDENGQVLGVFAAARDISQIKQAEEEIRKLNSQLEERVIERTRQLEAANKELEAFSYSVSHDLRAPLRSIDGFSQALLEDYSGVLDEQGKDYLARVRSASQRMSQLIDDMLVLSRVTRREMKRTAVDLSALANIIAAELVKTQPQRKVELEIASGLVVNGDAELLRAMLENLIGNAWKFTSNQQSAKIEFGVMELYGKPSYFVRDNGVGFDMAYSSKLFQAFQRLHLQSEFPGTGIGLATVKRIINRHGGRIWAESEAGNGATFYFNL
ncbi:MAG: PAS domain S-box protein [Candidatus Methanoperedens sp.]|nr:PAS domain S-box protein [Candidatus Methanoperedens sp.]